MEYVHVHVCVLTLILDIICPIEGRGQGDRGRSSSSRLMAEGPSSFMEYDRPLGAPGLGGGARGRRHSTPRKNITATVK